MHAYTTIFAAAMALLASTTTAAPTTHYPGYPPLTGVVKRITAGFSGKLVFEPENVVADPGDVVEFHFLPKNHTIVQSSFDRPCEPLYDGVFSGFNFATAEGESDNVFRFVVKDRKPFWYYCSQTAGNHCQMGMAGVINQNFDDNERTLAKYKLAAKHTVTVQPSANPSESNPESEYGLGVQPNTFFG